MATNYCDCGHMFDHHHNGKCQGIYRDAADAPIMACACGHLATTA